MPDVVTFGEVMLRLTPPGRMRFAQAPHFEISFGGSEANVAVMIAQLGGSVGYVTRLPENELAQRAINELRGYGVGTEFIARGGDRMGVYFLEQGASQRPGKIIYDRANSAIAEVLPGQFDWDRIFAGAKWFHWSGITPALSPSTAVVLGEAIAAARRAGLVVSFELNYRAKLWSSPAQAGDTLAPLMKGVDICITSAEEAHHVFGIALLDDAVRRETESARRLCTKFGFQSVALTHRKGTTADVTNWGATLYHENQGYVSPRHDITIVDRVGAGDSFTGALIFSLLRGDDPGRAIHFAVAASALKHSIPGDYSLVSLEEVNALLSGTTGGRVQR
jgi:2-dehydro-3-deoxygluconokinase